MELTAFPIKVEAPTGDTLYRGAEAFSMEAGRQLLIREKKGGESEDHFERDVPDGKQWSVRIVLEITETDA